jgi:predicted nuclease of predicted toxin-antitoxin system
MPEVDKNFIVIDTNVFEHLLNEDKNIVLGDVATKTEEKHINRLLKFMQKQGYILCIDKQYRIMEEYKYRLKETIKNASDERDEIQILRYWIGSDNAHYYSEKEINLNLDKILKKIILNDDNKPETTDCIFVHTAAINQCTLVTNDSDYTLCINQPLKNNSKSRTKNGKINSNNKQKNSLQNQIQNIHNRKDKIKDAIKKNLKHEETDILNSLEAHQTYLYPVVNNLD